MRRIALGGIAAATVLLVIAGCASAPGAGSSDPPSAPAAAPTTPTEAPTTTATPSEPAPSGSATSVVTGAAAQARLAELPVPSARGPVLAAGTVLDPGAGHEAGTAVLCFHVFTSLPPQCGGPAIVGWDWATVPHEEASGVRWSDDTVALRAIYDAAAFTLTLTQPPMDLASITLPTREVPAGDLDEATIAALQADLVTLDRADVLGNGGEDGTMVLEVVYDDGSMQAALDDIYGPGVVHVEPWFVD